MRISILMRLATVMALCVLNVHPAVCQTIQQKLDSLLKEVPKAKEDTSKVLLLNEISRAYFQKEPAKGIDYGRQTLKLATELNYDHGIIIGNSAIGRCYAVIDSLPKALQHFQASLFLARKLGRHEAEGNALTSIGSVYTNNGQHQKALDHLLEALKAYERAGMKNTQHVLNNLGSIYMKQLNHEKALHYYLEGIKVGTENNGPKGAIASLHANAGAAYIGLNQYEKALQYLFKALAVQEELGNTASIGNTVTNIGRAYLTLANINDPGLPDSLRNRERNLEKALHYEMRAMAICEELKMSEMLQAIYTNIANVYRAKGDYKSALFYFDKYNDISDTVRMASKEKEFAKIEAEFQVKRTTDSLKYVAALKDTEAKQRETERNGYAIVFACTGIIGILLVNRQKLKADQKRRAAEAEVQRAEAIAREQLDNFTRSIQEKNELIEKFTAEIEKYQALPCSVEVAENEQGLRDLQDSVILTDDQWAKFQSAFDKVYPGYIARAKEKFQGITASELRFIVLSRMRLNNKEMAAMLGVSHEAIRANKHRLLKKIQLPEGAALEEVVHSV